MSNQDFNNDQNQHQDQENELNGKKTLNKAIKHIEGVAYVMYPDGSLHPLTENHILEEGHKIVAGKDGDVIVYFQSGESCKLSPNQLVNIEAKLFEEGEQNKAQLQDASEIKTPDTELAQYKMPASPLVDMDYREICADIEDDGFGLVSLDWWEVGNIFAGWPSTTFAPEFQPIEWRTRIEPEEIFQVTLNDIVRQIGAPELPPATAPQTPAPENIAAPPPPPPPTPETDLELTKTVDNATPCPCNCKDEGGEALQDGKGDDCGCKDHDCDNLVTYTITVTNNGLIQADGVIANDGLFSEGIPSFYEFIGADPSVGSFNPMTGEWSIGSLAPGQTVTLQLTFKVLPAEDFEECVGTTDLNTTPLEAQTIWLNDPHQAQITHVYKYGEFDPNSATLPGGGSGVGALEFAVDGNPAVSHGIGVEGGINIPGATDAVNQIGYNPNTGLTEGIAIDLGAPAYQMTVYISHLFLDEQQGEYGQLTAYDANGNKLGTIFFGEAQNGLTPNTTLPDGSIFVDVDYDGSNNIGSFTVTDQYFGATYFQTVVFSAAPYGIFAKDTIDTDSSDYFLQKIDYKVKECLPNVDNTANVTSTTPDSDPTNNSDSVTVDPSTPDLSVVKTFDNNFDKCCPPTHGDEITFTILVKNNGCDDATGIKIIDTLGAGFDFCWASEFEGVMPYVIDDGGKEKVIWKLPDDFVLKPGESFELTLKAKIDLKYDCDVNLEQICNTVEVKSDCDSNLVNNEFKSTLDPGDADLCVDKKVDNKYPDACCDEVKYTITVTNKGNDTACDVKIVDCLPEGLKLKDVCLPEGVDYYLDGDKIIVKLDKLAAGETFTFDIKAKVDIDTVEEHTINEGNNWDGAQLAAFQFGSGFETAGKYDANLADGVVAHTANGAGVENDNVDPIGGSKANEVGHNPWDGTSEALGITLEKPAFFAEISLSLFFNGEGPNGTNDPNGTGEYGVLSAYGADGSYLGSIFFGETQNGIGPGSTIIYNGQPIEFVDVTYQPGSDNVGSIQVSDHDFGGYFQHLVFTSLPYGTDLPLDGSFQQQDSGDYYVKGITYKTIDCPDPIVNKVEVSSDTFDPNKDNNHDSVIIKPQQGDLTISKEIVGDPDKCCKPSHGDEITFKIIVSNIGCGEAREICVTDLLGPGLDFCSASDGGYMVSDEHGIEKIKWNLDDLKDGESKTLYLTAKVDLKYDDCVDLEKVCNTVEVNSACDPNPYNDSDKVCFDPGDADLCIDKTVDNKYPDACCDEVKYTITVTNKGNDAACDVKIVDCLPDGIKLQDVCLPEGIDYCIEGDKIIVKLDKLEAGETFKFDIKAKVDIQDNDLHIEDGTQAPTSGEAATQAAWNDVGLRGLDYGNINYNTFNPTTLNYNDANVAFTSNGIGVNDGSHPADLAESPPDQTGFNPDGAPGTVGPFDGTSEALVMNLGYEAHTATIKVSNLYWTENNENGDNGNIDNTSKPGDGEYGLLSAYDATGKYLGSIFFGETQGNINLGSTLTINGKTVNFIDVNYEPGSTNVGSFTIKDQDFDCSAFKYLVFESLPYGASINNAFTNPPEQPNGDASDYFVRHISFDVNKCPDPIVNKVEVSSDTYDPNKDNNHDSVVIKPQEADLCIKKEIVGDPDKCCKPSHGDQITFKIIISNNGCGEAREICVTDLLGPGLDFCSASDGGYMVSDEDGIEKIKWNLDDLKDGESKTLYLTAKVDLKEDCVDLDKVCNTAEVKSACDPNLGNNSDTVCFNPGDTDLCIEKTVDNKYPDACCDEIKYTIAVTNKGDEDACDVKIVDCLPDGIKLQDVCLPDGVNYYVEDGKIIVTLDKLAAGDTFSFDIKAKVEVHQNPEGWWTGDGNAYDIVDSHDGSYNGDYAPGKFNEAFAISSNGDGVIVPDSSVFDAEHVSVTAWVNSSNQDNFSYIFAKGGDSEAASFALYTGMNGGIQFYVYNGTNFVTSPDFGTGIWDGQWHQVVGTFDGTNVSLYVDGNLVGSTQVGNTFGNIDYNLDFHDIYIGQYANGANNLNFDNGLIDDVGFFDKALTAEQIKQLYTGSTSFDPIINKAEVSSDTLDTNKDNNCDIAIIKPQAADLCIVKEVKGIDPCCKPSDGDKVTFRITVKNNGQAQAREVYVNESLLIAGLMIDQNSIVTTKGTYDFDQGKWTIGELSNGEAVTLTFNATIDLQYAGNGILDNITNTATVHSACDPVMHNNISTVTLDPGDADLCIDKSVNNYYPEAGDVVKYTIKVANHGDENACKVVVTDSLPEGVTLLSATGDYAIHDGKLTWNLEKLAGGECVTFEVLAKVKEAPENCYEAGLQQLNQDSDDVQAAWNDHDLDAFKFGSSFIDNHGNVKLTGDGTIAYDANGIGVKNSAGHTNLEAPNQIGNDPNNVKGSNETNDDQTEGLVVKLKGATDSVDIKVSHLFWNENENNNGSKFDGEYGKLTAFGENGHKIGSIFFGETQNGIEDETLADGSKFVDVNYGNSTNVGTFTITDDMFGGQLIKYLAFSALPYGAGEVDKVKNVENDSSDYYLMYLKYSVQEQLDPIKNEANVYSDTFDPYKDNNSDKVVIYPLNDDEEHDSLIFATLNENDEDKDGCVKCDYNDQSQADSQQQSAASNNQESSSQESNEQSLTQEMVFSSNTNSNPIFAEQQADMDGGNTNAPQQVQQQQESQEAMSAPTGGSQAQNAIDDSMQQAQQQAQQQGGG